MRGRKQVWNKDGEKRNLQIFKLQFRLARVWVFELESGSCPDEAAVPAGLHWPISLSLRMQLNVSGAGLDPPKPEEGPFGSIHLPEGRH